MTRIAIIALICAVFTGVVQADLADDVARAEREIELRRIAKQISERAKKRALAAASKSSLGRRYAAVRKKCSEFLDAGKEASAAVLANYGIAIGEHGLPAWNAEASWMKRQKAEWQGDPSPMVTAKGSTGSAHDGDTQRLLEFCAEVPQSALCRDLAPSPKVTVRAAWRRRYLDAVEEAYTARVPYQNKFAACIDERHALYSELESLAATLRSQFIKEELDRHVEQLLNNAERELLRREVRRLSI